MTVSSVATGYDGISLLAGNTSYDPAGTWLIQRIAGTGSSGTITFSSIPQNYKHLQLRYNLLDIGGNGINFRVNSDTGTNYTQHALGSKGTTRTAQGSGGATSYSAAGYAYGTVGTYSNVGIIDIYNYANTSTYKTARSIFGADNNSTNGSVEISSGVWLNTNAITSLSIFNGGTILTNSTFALYGMV